MSPAVTVIIPCYNHARYLPLAIQSILAQEFADWEIVVVNDGSTDNTAAVAEQFDDLRIRYIYQENQGLSAARNTGIRAAQGQYLAFLDADDEWEPGFLQQCVRALEKDDALAGVYTCNYFIDEHGTVLPQIGGEAVSRSEFRHKNWEGGFFPPVAVLVRAAIVREVGLFDTQLTSEEDWDLWLRISQRHPMQGIPEPLARYRVYPGSMSTNAARMHANRMTILAKYWGAPEEEPTQWAEEKRRAYGFAYRHTCIGYLQQGQPGEGLRFLARAVSIWPGLLERLDTFYELVCGDKAWGYRGQAHALDIEGSATELFKWLDDLFTQAGPALNPWHRIAYGNTFLALGMLSYQAGHYAEAKDYLLHAVAAHPRLLVRSSAGIRILNLFSGLRLARWGRALQGSRLIRTLATIKS